MRHTIKTATITVMLCLGLMLLAGVAQTPSYRFQQAVDLLESKGDVPGALKLFEELAKGPDRSVAARSLLYIGSCHEKLGKDGAQKAYERIVREFADQREPAAEAQARLAALGRAAAAANGRALVVRRVWAGRNIDVMGAASADGRYLTFVDWDTGNLAVHDLATGEIRALTNKRVYSDSPEFAMDSTFSPDSKQVAYIWFNKEFFYEMRLIGVDGSHARTLYSNKERGWAQPYAWSADGKQILARLGKKNLALVSVADGSAREFKVLDAAASLEGLILSPDGRFAVYGFKGDIFAAATSDGRETPLVSHPADDSPLAFTPDGSRLLFLSDRTGSVGVWAVRFGEGKTQGEPELIKRDVGRITPMGLTRNGSLFYAQLDVGFNIYLAALDPATGSFTAPVPLSQRWVGRHSAPDWSPDGKLLACLFQPPGKESGTQVISIRTLDTGAERQLKPALKYTRQPEWSPDGRHFLVRAVDSQGRWGLHTVDAQTGEVTTLVRGDVFWANHAWSPDGKAIFYQQGQTRLLRRDYSSGEEKLLTRDEAWDFGRALAVSPDGSTLAYTAYEREKKSVVLKLMPAGGGEARELLRTPEQESIRAGGLVWMRDGKRILFIKKSDLWAIAAEGGEPHKLNLAIKGLTKLCFHPDGQQVAFQAGGRSGEVWVLENFLPPLKSAAK